jgi:predicted short-subunit dehydrogenase-like oxidoreductase (DUF2520 family)
MENLEQISWIGCGKVGRTLARALKNAGYSAGAIVCKTVDSARKAMEFIGTGKPGTNPAAALETGSIHFITTNDDAIADVVARLNSSATDLKGHYFFHTSASLPSTVLESLHAKGAEIASMHPVQVFADPDKALETLPGVYYAIEGSDRAMTLAVQMVDRLQGKLLLIPTGRKALYHIAGVFAANYLTVMVEFALSIMEDLGETPEEAYQAFLPLMVGALENIEEFGVAGALTGPIARGDIKTIESHLENLKQLRPEVGEAYKMLGRGAVSIAMRGGGLSAEKAQRILDLLS